VPAPAAALAVERRITVGAAIIFLNARIYEEPDLSPPLPPPRCVTGQQPGKEGAGSVPGGDAWDVGALVRGERERERERGEEGDRDGERDHVRER
jgi:hypothetical protein